MVTTVTGPASAVVLAATTARESMRARFPARRVPAAWPATLQPRGTAGERLTRPPFVLDDVKRQQRRVRGLAMLLDWLAAQPGQSWQERWLASGADRAGAGWRQLPAQWLRDCGLPGEGRQAELCAALTVVICADLIRPSLGWLVSADARGNGALVRGMARTRDGQGLGRLQELCDRDPGVSARAGRQAVHRTAQILAAKGGAVGSVTAGDVLDLLDAEAAARAGSSGDTTVFYRMLHQMGVLGDQAPARLREFRTPGQLTPEELIDRYHLQCRPVRDLLVDYLRERQAALDYASLNNLSHFLGRCFWQDLERHHPGIASLHLPAEVAAAWKQRLRTRPQAVTASTGEKTVIYVPRVNYRQCLIPVRAFYLDLAQWAADDPARWAIWSVPCPVSGEEISQRKFQRHRKARMDARTRERLPVLPVLVRTTSERRQAAEALLAAARQAQPGETFTAAGQTLTRSVLIRTAPARIWADDPGTGKRRDLSLEEDHAFWAWAAVEVLRLTGCRAEELAEITHHSLVQYRLPTTGEVVPLLQIAPSKTDEERLLLVSPELADVLSAIIRRVRGPAGTVPLVPLYDRHECVWLAPSPLLFQRSYRAENRAISERTLGKVLHDALAHTGLIDPGDGLPLRYTPHDFRRIFITDAILNGLPPHIAQVIAGHRDINVTMGYKAVYPEEAIQAHLAFLARRRALRPSGEYRAPTEREWQEFLGHFELRKVATGTCGRAFSTPCIHEHACFSELTVSFPFVRFLVWVWKAGGMGDSTDDEARVGAVDAGQGVAEADRGPSGDAGGEEEDPALAAAGRELAGAQGGDGGFPVSAGEQGDAVADAGADSDEPAGEVPAVQPAAAVDEQAGTGFEGIDAVGAGQQRVAELAGVQGGHGVPSGAGGAERPAMSGNAGMPRWTACSWRCRDASIWASLSSVPARLTLRPSISPSQPSRSASAMRSCRLDRISSRRCRWAGSGLRSEHLTHACSWTQGDANARAQVPTETFRFSKWARKASHSWSVGVRYSSLGRVARRRAMKARWASIASAG
jgi:integrase